MGWVLLKNLKATGDRRSITVRRRELMYSRIYFSTNGAVIVACRVPAGLLSRIEQNFFQRMFDGQRFLFAEPI
jgi:hypothetical protein